MAERAFAPFRLGRYNVLSPLGKGGMAEVYLAEQRGAGGFARLVTIKRIRTNLCQDEMFIKMFVDEANLMVNIHHPNVVQVMELAEEGKDLYMVLEFVDGCDLETALHKRRNLGTPLPLNLALYIVWSLMRGLAQAHEARSATGEPLGLIHRDVTPGNVLITRSGVVKLADFGVAKAAGRLTQTEAGQVKGKLSYMAPEMLVLADVSQRSDIFSAGALFWETLVGQQLFTGPGAGAVMQAIVTDPVPTPRSVRPDIPADVDKLVMRALARDPRDRHASAQELEDDIFRVLAVPQPETLAKDLAAWLRDNVPMRSQAEIAALPRPITGVSSPPVVEPPPVATPARMEATLMDPRNGGFSGSLNVAPAPVEDDFFSPLSSSPVPPVVAPVAPARSNTPLMVGTAMPLAEPVVDWPAPSWEALVTGEPAIAPLISTPAPQARPPLVDNLRFTLQATSGTTQLGAEELWQLMASHSGDMRTQVSAGQGSLALGALGWLLMLDNWTPVSEPADSFSLSQGDLAALREALRRHGETKASGALWLRGPQGQKAVMFLVAGELRYVWDPAETLHAARQLLDEPAQLGQMLQAMIRGRVVAWKAARDCLAAHSASEQIARRFKGFLMGRVANVWAWRRYAWRFATGTGAPYELPGTGVDLAGAELQMGPGA